MADLSNSSFIPKRGPVKHKPGGTARHIYIFTLISYILMFATLLATGGVFFYSGYIERQEDAEITALNNEIGSFSNADLQTVIEFEQRLSQASGRLEKGVSLAAIFEAIEAATIDTVQITDLELAREDDEKFLLTATIDTDTFDSTIFQRDIYENEKTNRVTSVVFTDVKNTSSGSGSDEERSEGSEDIKDQVSFTAELTIPLNSVPFEGDSARNGQPIIITDPAIENVTEETEMETDTEVNNEENI